MRANNRKSVCLGDVVAAAYDAAKRVTKDDRKKSLIAAQRVRSYLVKAGRLDLARRLDT